MVSRRNPLFLFALIMPFIGCGKTSSEDPELNPQKLDLTGIHELYASFMKVRQQPPQKSADLDTNENEIGYGGAVMALRSNNYVVVWGINTDSQPDAVVAYEKNAATAGGWAVLANGTVKQVTADEIKAVKK